MLRRAYTSLVSKNPIKFKIKWEAYLTDDVLKNARIGADFSMLSGNMRTMKHFYSKLVSFSFDLMF